MTGGAAVVEGEFERLGGLLCDPSPKAFFRRLRSPLDSLTVCWRSSAISMRVGDNKSFVCGRILASRDTCRELRVLFIERRAGEAKIELIDP